MWPTDHGPQVQWCEGPDVKQKAVLFEQLEYMLRTCDPSFCPSFPPDWKHCVVFLQGPWSSLTHWCEWLPFLVLLLGVLGGSRRIACFFRDFIIPQNGTKGYIRKMFVISCVQSLGKVGRKSHLGSNIPLLWASILLGVDLCLWGWFLLFCMFQMQILRPCRLHNCLCFNVW